MKNIFLIITTPLYLLFGFWFIITEFFSEMVDIQAWYFFRDIHIVMIPIIISAILLCLHLFENLFKNKKNQVSAENLKLYERYKLVTVFYISVIIFYIIFLVFTTVNK
jgi:C4-dicarboxylate transporter